MEEYEIQKLRCIHLADKKDNNGYLCKAIERVKELEAEVESQDKTIDNLIECQTEREKYVHSLEEENAMLKKANNISEDVTVEDITQVMNKLLEEFKKEFIPISVIQNKIKSLEKEIDLAIDNSKGGLDEEFIKNGTELLIKKRVLQEILEKGNK